MRRAWWQRRIGYCQRLVRRLATLLTSTLRREHDGHHTHCPHGLERQPEGGIGTSAFDSSQIGQYPVSWASRAEEPDGKTSPEELIAAAHSSCFSMALSHGLAQAGTPPTKLTTQADVTFQPGTGITGIHLTVEGEVPGLDEAGVHRGRRGRQGELPGEPGARGHARSPMRPSGLTTRAPPARRRGPSCRSCRVEALRGFWRNG